jgi:hypothetical protein
VVRLAARDVAVAEVEADRPTVAPRLDGRGARECVEVRLVGVAAVAGAAGAAGAGVETGVDATGVATGADARLATWIGVDVGVGATRAWIAREPGLRGLAAPEESPAPPWP